MLWALVSDIHGRGDRLARALADAQARGASRVLALGDVGSYSALDILDGVDAQCVFGNWEASGWRGMPSPYRSQVARWPAQYRRQEFWAGHASPVWPEGLAIGGVVEYLREHQLHWLGLFPSLHHSGEARWAALAELKAAGAPLFFHGHTHVQEAWRWHPDTTAPQLWDTQSIIENDGSHYLIGVGSVAEPHDGGGVCYTLYDDAARRVEWRRV
jgi:hypothetical protein